MNNIIREDNITPKTTLVLQPMPEQLLTVKDVSSLLKCNVATVHNLRKTGLLRFLKLGSYKCRVSTIRWYKNGKMNQYEWDGRA